MQKKTNILIIDDNTDLSQNLNDVLTEIGYNTVVALDGKSAINLCRKKDFDLALIDMKLPDIDGLGLIEKLSEILPELEYIIITAYGTLESAKKATGFKKIVAYELKPLDIDHLLVLIHQVIERKKAVEAQQESEQRFRILLENVPTVAVQGYNTDGDIHYWNKANESIYGYKAEEAIGKNLIDLIIPPEMKEDVRKIIKHGAKIGEMPPAAEITLIRKDGKPVTVFSSHAVVQQSGKEPELFCIDVDLTERKQAEEELAKHRDHLEELVKERTKELEEKNEKLEHFNKLFVDREFRIKELKDKVKKLEGKKLSS